MKMEIDNLIVAKILGERSQFTYHHDLQRMNGLSGCSRGEVAQILKKKYPDEEAYLSQVKYGTIKYLFERCSEELVAQLFEIAEESVAIETFCELRALYKEANEKVEMFTEIDKELLSA